MRALYRKLLGFILCGLARRIIARRRPSVVGVTGSVGKSSTKEAIFAVLERERSARKSPGNLNNEIGFPLAVIGGEYRVVGGARFALRAVIKGLRELARQNGYPELLILEYGADHPGDLDRLIAIARPQVAVVSAVSETPVHVEFYADADAVAREKAKLVRALPRDGLAVLNADDPLVLGMANGTRAEVATFGFGARADVRITAFGYAEEGAELGIAFRLESKGEIASVKMPGVLGRGQAYAAASAAAVGARFGVPLARAASALALYRPLPGRARLILGVKSSRIIDDTYNAAPLSTREALVTLRELKGRRKVAVLGDMAELGKYSARAHEEIGEAAVGAADVLVTVGSRARLIAEGARRSGFVKKNIVSFGSAEEARKEVERIVEPGDLVLVKGSQSMRMEKIVLEIMAEPEKAGDLLVRQYGKWLAT